MHKISKISPFYVEGDIKYYWRVHCKKMRERKELPVTYPRFYDRLKRGWILKKAIETPSRKTIAKAQAYQFRDAYRQHVVNFVLGEVDTSPTLDELIQMNRIQMPKPKPTLWKRIKKWFSNKKRA